MEYGGYSVVNNNFCNYVIKPLGKGSVPKELSGMYTSTAMSKQAIDFYKVANTKKPRGKVNGPTKDND